MNTFPMPITVLAATKFVGEIDGDNIESYKIDILGNEYDLNDNKVTESSLNQKFGYVINKYKTAESVVNKLETHGHFPVRVTAQCAINKNNQIEVKDINADFIDLTFTETKPQSKVS